MIPSYQKITLRIAMWLTIALGFTLLPLFEQGQAQQLTDKFRRVEQAIPNQYIVVLKEEAAGPRGAFSKATDIASAIRASYGGNILHVYTHALNGFSIQMPESVAMALSQDPRVEFVEEDGEAFPLGVQDEDAFTMETQLNPPWGLDRIDQRNLPLDSRYTYTNTGAGVNVYVIDSGINYAHVEFGGRAVFGADFVGAGGNDCMGHGTHVAGTIGGSRYGAAKGVRLYSVRVFGCAGGSPWSTIIAGVDWVTANRDRTRPAVANMSLGGLANGSIDIAVRNSIASGVTYAIAAGNNGADATFYSPAHVLEAITVGNTTTTDFRYPSSNYGSVLDLFAPGTNITSAWIGSTTAINTITGTSMATPHVAGVAAMYLQSNPGATPSTVSQVITNNATFGVVGNPGPGSPNRLLYSGFITPPCTYNISPTSASFSAGGGTGSVSVTAPGGCSWAATSNAPWITITFGSSGSGNGTVNYSVAANPSSTPRSGTLTIAGRTFTVNQAGASCTYSISPTGQSFPHTGGTGNVAVTATPGCNWTAMSNAPWITITSGGSGTGNGAVNYSVASNTSSASRSGTLTIAGWTFTVTQAGVPCTYTISPTSASFEPGGGSGSVSVTASASGCGWTAVSNASWITVSPTSGSGNGTVTYLVAANPNPSSRTGTLTIAGHTFTVTQEGQSQPPISFAPAANYPVGADPQSVAIGDLNRDGTLDLAVTNWDDNTVSLLFGDGSGRFIEALPLSVRGGPYSIAIDDLNGDGAADLAVTTHITNTVAILIGDGAGSFAEPTHYDVGANPRSVTIRDLNGDGAVDLAVANFGSDTVSLLFGDGAGAFTRYLPDYAVGVQPHSIAIGDLNGDAIPDLAVANNGSANVSILLGDGSGSFGPPSNFDVGYNPRSVAIGDLNGDEVADLAVASFGSDRVTLLFGDGGGSFGAATDLALPEGSGPHSVAVGDLNRDGRADLAVINLYRERVSILLGDGRGSFGAGIEYGVGNSPRRLAMGDINGDGRVDLAVVNAWSNNVSILLNTTP